MAIFSNSKVLENRLVRAREKYARKRDRVLSAAQARRSVVRETIADLQEEAVALSDVVEQARKS